MRKTDRSQAETFVRNQRVRKYLRRAVALLSAVVILFTVNTLKRNANTLERIATCGYEEHTHDETCYDDSGALICGLEEHVHTDACFQAAPVYEEEELDLADVTEDDGEEPEDLEPVEEPEEAIEDGMAADERPFRLEDGALLSEIVEALNVDVDMKRVLEVGAVENDESQVGQVAVEAVDGDWRVSALRAFDEAELAIVTDDDILTVKLVAGAPAGAEPVAEVEEIADIEETAEAVETADVQETPVEEIGEADIEEVTVEETDADGTAEADVEETAEDEAAEDETAEDETAEDETAEDETAEDEAVEVELITGDGEAVEDAEAENTEAEAAEDAEAETAEAEAAEDAEAETAETEAAEDAEAETAEAEAAEDAEAETAETEAAEDAEAETAETEAAEDAEAETAEAEAAEDAEAETAETEAAEDEKTETAEAADVEADKADAAETAEAGNTETENTETEDTEETETAEAEGEEADAEEAQDEEALEEAAEGEEGEDAEEAGDEAEGEAAQAEAEPSTLTVSVDLSSVDLMSAASVEADTVKLSVADLLTGEDDAVQLEGELAVDNATFAETATIVSSDNVDVQDGVITLSAEAMETGSVTLALETPAETEAGTEAAVEAEADVEAEVEAEAEAETQVQTQVVQIDLTGYTGRVTDGINSDPAVQIVPAEGNSLPADAYAAVKPGDVPEALLDAEAAESETTVQSAVAYDITITNDNNDEISDTGAVEVTLTPGDLNALADVPETATVSSLEYELYHIHDDGTCEKVEDAVFDVAEDGFVNSVFFTTDSFSTYVVRYTVDFTYVDVDGNEHFWQFPGEGSYALKDVLAELGIEGEEITDATLELTEQVGEAGEFDLYLTQDLETEEWFINSDNAFDDTYTLTVTVDETEYRIIVTDAQTMPLVVNLYDYTGNPVGANVTNSLGNGTYGVVVLYTNGVRKTGSVHFSEGIGSGMIVAPDSASGDIQVVKLYNDAKNVISDWTDNNAADQNKINNAVNEGKLSEFQGYALQENGLKVESGKMTINLQQVPTKQYNVRLSIPDNGLTINNADKYYLLVKAQPSSGDPIYGWAQVFVNPDDTQVDVPISWLDQNGHPLSNDAFTGAETVEYKIYTTHVKSDGTKDGFSSFDKIKNEQNKVTIQDGDSINTYVVHYIGRISPEMVTTDDGDIVEKICDVVKFQLPGGTISKAYIDSFLNDAKDFGYYTEEYKNQTADIEATIGAAKMSAVIVNGPNGTADFGYSNRNLAINVLKVLKVFTDRDGNPIQNKDVTIRLKDKDGKITDKQGNTGTDGRFQVEFDGLEPGDYSVSEFIDGREITQNEAANVGNLYVDFSATEARFLNNTNLNYFGQVIYDSDSKLAEVLQKGTRVPLVVLTDDPTTVNRAVTSGSVSNITVYENGTNGYKHYDIVNDMKHLRELSKELIGATDSATVRVLTYKASDIPDNGIKLEDDGRYIVINVLMDSNTFTPMVTLDGVVLDGNFENHGKENSTKVLYNLLSADGTKGYCEGGTPQEFNTSTTAAGIILAPWANAHVLGGVFGGTIISKEVNREGNELHSFNPNQRQTLNITIQNIMGAPKVGMLELKKEFDDESIKDKLTYFTFKVTLRNDDLTKITKAFPASGLKSGEEVTFEEDGSGDAVAYVQVRAHNSVTIANLPAGTTYEVEEITTAATAHYVHVKTDVNGTTIAGATSKGEGEIKAGETEKVTMINDLRKTGLTLKKTVNNSKATDATFTFDLYLWNEDEETSTKTAFTNASGVKRTDTNEQLTLTEVTDTTSAYYPAGVWSGVTLTNGQEITIDGLPVGLCYAFVERTGSMPAGYGVVTQDGKAEGVLDANGSLAEIVNTYSAKASVTLKKVWSGTPDKDVTLYLLRFKKNDTTNNSGSNEGGNGEGGSSESGSSESGSSESGSSESGSGESGSGSSEAAEVKVLSSDGIVKAYSDKFNVGDTVTITIVRAWYWTCNYSTNTNEHGNLGDGKIHDNGNDRTFSETFTIPNSGLLTITLDKDQYNFGDCRSITISKASAFASPFQLAWSPFAAYADEATLGALPTGIANGVTGLPSDYVLDDGWPVPLKVSEGLTKTIEDLEVKDASGNDYYYAVVEADMAGYKVTYSHGGDNPQAISASELTDKEHIVTLTATNTYTYTSATPHAVKMLDGVQFNGYLSNGTTPATFTFTIRQISPEGSDYQQTVTTAADGTITFPSIEYHTAGDRIYEISEAVGTDKNIVYTTSKVYWKVFVTGTNGVLTATDRYYVNAVCNTPTNPDNVAQFENHELTHVDIFKQWSLNTADAVDEYPGAGTPPEVRVHLWRKGEGGMAVEIDSATGKPVLSNATATPYTVPYDGKAGKWQLHIDGLEKYYGQRQPYEYYIVEDPENLQGWTPTRYRANNGNGSNQGSDNTVTGDGELTVVNSKSLVALPATGGVGTNAIYAVGAGLVLLALAGWLLAARKRRDF